MSHFPGSPYVCYPACLRCPVLRTTKSLRVKAITSPWRFCFSRSPAHSMTRSPDGAPPTPSPSPVLSYTSRAPPYGDRTVGASLTLPHGRFLRETSIPPIAMCRSAEGHNPETRKPRHKAEAPQTHVPAGYNTFPAGTNKIRTSYYQNCSRLQEGFTKTCSCLADGCGGVDLKHLLLRRPGEANRAQVSAV